MLSGKITKTTENSDEQVEYKQLYEGGYLATCSSVVELESGDSYLLAFEPFDDEGNHYSSIGITLPKNMKESDAVRQLWFTLGDDLYPKSFEITSADDIAKKAEGMEFGIIVTRDYATGWLHISDFFFTYHAHDVGKIPVVSDEIIRCE